MILNIIKITLSPNRILWDILTPDNVLHKNAPSTNTSIEIYCSKARFSFTLCWCNLRFRFQRNLVCKCRWMWYWLLDWCNPHLRHREMYPLCSGRIASDLHHLLVGSRIFHPGSTPILCIWNFLTRICEFDICTSNCWQSCCCRMP